MTNETPARQIWYLHGFASSPASVKATYFAEQLACYGLELHRPDFNVPGFESLTVTRMLSQLEQGIAAVGPASTTLIGSSLGGAVAILAAARLPQVERLVLLAPSLLFAKPGHPLLPPERLDTWRREGSLLFFHHAFGEPRPLGLAFYEDSLRYDPSSATITQPVLVFQGLRDTSVDPATVEAFARERSNVMLCLLDDDHGLAASLPRMWRDMRAFLELDL